MSVDRIERPLRGSGASADYWAAFVGARDDRARLTAWLALLMAHVPEAALGAVLRVDHAGGALTPIAVAPDPRTDLGPLRDIAARVLASGRPAVAPPAEPGGEVHIACPVGPDGEPTHEVAVLSLRGASGDAAQLALREMHWAAGWLVARGWQRVANRPGTARRGRRRRSTYWPLPVNSPGWKPRRWR